MPASKPSLPARRNHEPLDELSPLTLQKQGASTHPAPDEPKGRKITLNLDPVANEALQKFIEDFNVSQSSLINWAIKEAIEGYRSGKIEAEFRQVRNRIVPSK